MKRLWIFGSVCVALLVSVVILINPQAQVLRQAQIAFSSDRDGNDEIYVMDADGKNPRRLTNNSGRDICPAWSPDGQRIALASYSPDREANYGIYVMDADGKNSHRLTDNLATDMAPDWFDPAFAHPVSASSVGNTVLAQTDQ